jgi:hypothetical protein
MPQEENLRCDSVGLIALVSTGVAVPQVIGEMNRFKSQFEEVVRVLPAPSHLVNSAVKIRGDGWINELRHKRREIHWYVAVPKTLSCARNTRANAAAALASAG